jgi:hypothetical protein
MPHKPLDKLKLELPAWIGRLDDPCLRDVAVQALVARQLAVKAGALRDKKASKIVQSADETLRHAVERDDGLACKRAATAVRKYVVATAKAGTAKDLDELGRGRRR